MSYDAYICFYVLTKMNKDMHAQAYAKLHTLHTCRQIQKSVLNDQHTPQPVSNAVLTEPSAIGITDASSSIYASAP